MSVKGKTQSEPHKRIERITEGSELSIVQCGYLVLKDTAASDGLKVLSTYVKSFLVRPHPQLLKRKVQQTRS